MQGDRHGNRIFSCALYSIYRMCETFLYPGIQFGHNLASLLPCLPMDNNNVGDPRQTDYTQIHPRAQDTCTDLYEQKDKEKVSGRVFAHIWRRQLEHMGCVCVCVFCKLLNYLQSQIPDTATTVLIMCLWANSLLLWPSFFSFYSSFCLCFLPASLYEEVISLHECLKGSE